MLECPICEKKIRSRPAMELHQKVHDKIRIIDEKTDEPSIENASNLKLEELEIEPSKNENLIDGLLKEDKEELICGNCGAKVKRDYKYCGCCGKELDWSNW
jgi:hypothetical protein